MISEHIGQPTTQNLNFGTVSTATETIVNTGSVELSEGIYAIQYSVTFAENETGFRAVGINTTANPSTISAYGYRFVARLSALSGDRTIVILPVLQSLTSATTLYFHVEQDSGSTLNCYPRVFIVKLA